jgi:para-nitrobenzyl esterase
MDQQAALRWMRRNIHAFGGNPRKVAIAGESAGGLSVLAHVASPRVRTVHPGHRAERRLFPDADVAGRGRNGGRGLRCQGQLCQPDRGLPARSAALDNPGQRRVPIEPVPGVVDGEVLTQSVGTAIASGQFNRVPIINGTTHDEYRLLTAFSELQGAPVTAANYRAMIASTLGVAAVVAAVVATEYPLAAYPSPAVALSAVGTDGIFACPALRLGELASKFVPTFAYEFNDEDAPQRYLPPVSFPYRAAHASELQYLFDLPLAPIAGTLTEQQETLATSMRRYWAHFAARGVPSSADQPWWPRFNRHSQKMLSLAPPQPQVETGFAAEHRCAFWDQT